MRPTARTKPRTHGGEAQYLVIIMRLKKLSALFCIMQQTISTTNLITFNSAILLPLPTGIQTFPWS